MGVGILAGVKAVMLVALVYVPKDAEVREHFLQEKAKVGAEGDCKLNQASGKTVTDSYLGRLVPAAKAEIQGRPQTHSQKSSLQARRR